MIEYLIKPVDDEWFDIPMPQAAKAYRPKSFASERIEGPGDWRIRCEGVDISFSYEDSGIQVSMEGDLGKATADQIADEIRQSIERVSKQKARLIAL